jgi:FkbM family methyltransferase
MISLIRLVGAGDQVLDIGGHIGYLTLHFASLVGESGHVYAFEPAPDNLRYIHQNTRSKHNVTVLPAAVGSEQGTATLFVEDLTGQNNTLSERPTEFERNSEVAGVRASTRLIEVDVVTIDGVCGELGITPDLIKIDVESHELAVLEGAIGTLESAHPIVLAEVAAQEEAVISLMSAHGYRLFSDSLEPLTDIRPGGNYFFLHEVDHAAEIGRATMARGGTP